jgi:hypothetical protein
MNEFVSYSLTMAFACSLPITEDIKQKLVNLLFNIKQYYELFFFSYFLKKEKQESKTSTFLRLETKHTNSKTTFVFSSIKSS